MSDKEYVVGRKFNGAEAVKWLNWLSIAALMIAFCAIVYAIGTDPVPKWAIGFALFGGMTHLMCEYIVRLID